MNLGFTNYNHLNIKHNVNKGWGHNRFFEIFSVLSVAQWQVFSEATETWRRRDGQDEYQELNPYYLFERRKTNDSLKCWNYWMGSLRL